MRGQTGYLLRNRVRICSAISTRTECGARTNAMIHWASKWRWKCFKLRSLLQSTRVGFSDIPGMSKNFSFSSQYLSTEQENRKHPQTGLTDSDDFYYIPAMSKNPTLVLKSKDLWFSGGVTLEGHNIQQMVAGRKGGLFINLGHRKREEERRESEVEGGRGS